MEIFIDIETIPSQAPGVREEIAASIKPPAQYKKAESIAEWMQENAAAEAEKQYRRLALDGAGAEIICVGWAIDMDGPLCATVRAKNELEGEFIQRFFSDVSAEIDKNTPTVPNFGKLPIEDIEVVAHNAAFDVGMLCRRSWANQVKMPSWFPRPSSRRGVICTMEMWAGRRDTIGLDRLCRALGIHSPKADGFDGSKVYDQWLTGDVEGVIAEYCMQDMAAMRRCYMRMQYGM